MRFLTDRLPKLEKAASKDESREPLTHAYLDVERQELFATDSFIVARIPVAIDKGDKTGPVSAQALTQLRRLKGRRLRLAGFKQDVMPPTWDGNGKGEPLLTLPRPEPLR